MTTQMKGPAAPEADRPLEAITVLVSKQLTRHIDAYAMIRGQTQQEYVVEALLGQVQADSEHPYYKGTPEYKEANGEKDDA